ncbi:MAG: hypothetical protein MJZ36_10715 [Bacteroidaceae bacterium]|nr:hypothetical protein [Bacteroidaceae bacterium]
MVLLVSPKSPEELGYYYAWGETYTKNTYNWSTYKWCNGTYNTLTKYCFTSPYGTEYGKQDKKETLELKDDAANVNWGGSWHIPSNSELQELYNNCTWKWTTQNGAKGYKIIGKNGNSIFLPAAGTIWDSTICCPDEGYYWTRTLNIGHSCTAAQCVFDSNNRSKSLYADKSRCYGCSVRPVLP